MGLPHPPRCFRPCLLTRKRAGKPLKEGRLDLIGRTDISFRGPLNRRPILNLVRKGVLYSLGSVGEGGPMGNPRMELPLALPPTPMPCAALVRYLTLQTIAHE